ncbi:hypothetical protein A9Q98_08565 [Thalassotalea sp. 42_200_T64]|nr:hypothetical protein A9Q98_08565 [Thalassotalea sp. 42_200_T64]
MTFLTLKDNYLFFTCLALSTVIFIFDLYIPLGVAAGVPHAGVVLLALRSNNPVYPLVFALSGTFLTILGYFYSAPAGIEWMVVTNRILAFLAIWITYLLGEQLKKIRTELQNSEHKFLLLAKQSPTMIWQANTAGQWIFCSKSWLTFTGNKLDELTGQGWLDNIHPDDREQLSTKYNNLINAHEPMQVECRINTADKIYHWFFIQGSPCYTESGKLTGFLGTGLDIDRRKKAEVLIAETKTKYYQKDKMAAIGALSSGILHEIRNPLASVFGLLNEVKLLNEGEQYSEQKQSLVDNYLAMIFEELNRLTRISQDLENFATMPTSAQDIYDLNDIIERTCRLMQHDERLFNIKLTLNLDRELPAMQMMPDQFVQILQHLLSNAVDACTEHGKITVTSTLIDDRVAITVNDNGVGMTEDELAQAGQEFFTTKDDGTGLGLSFCYHMIENMQGQLTIKAKPKLGCSATITLPMSA